MANPSRSFGPVRAIGADEIEAWCACPLRNSDDGFAGWVEGEREWVAEWHEGVGNLFAYAASGEFLGKYDVPMEEEGRWTLWAPTVRRGSRAVEVMESLATHVVAESRRRGIRAVELVLEGSHANYEIARPALDGAGFEEAEEKILVRRDLTAPLPALAPDLDVRPARNLPASSLRALCQAAEMAPEDIPRLASEGEAPIGLVVYAEGQPVGIALASSAPGDAMLCEEHVGLTREARGKGLGRRLFVAFLHAGRAAGAKTYVGSTPVGNVAMRRVFERAGCEEIGRRFTYQLAPRPPG